jgi:hypothetical protein
VMATVLSEGNDLYASGECDAAAARRITKSNLPNPLAADLVGVS